MVKDHIIKQGGWKQPPKNFSARFARFVKVNRVWLLTSFTLGPDTPDKVQSKMEDVEGMEFYWERGGLNSCVCAALCWRTHANKN